jgi:hypothetical protein
MLTSRDNREHPADEVYVTGTFDNWSKSTKLDKDGSVHKKTVNLPKSDEKILYKVRRRHSMCAYCARQCAYVIQSLLLTTYTTVC